MELGSLVDKRVGVPFDVWVVHVGEDERSPGRPDPSQVFTSESVAKQAAKGRGWYGGNARVSKFRVMRGADGDYYFIGEKVKDIDKVYADYAEKTREAALKKLTDEEKRVLGI